MRHVVLMFNTKEDYSAAMNRLVSQTGYELVANRKTLTVIAVGDNFKLPEVRATSVNIIENGRVIE